MVKREWQEEKGFWKTHSIQFPNSSHRTMDFENENNSLKMVEEEDDEGFLPTGGNK